MDFYIQGLGFNIDWEHRFGPKEPVYMQISKNGLILHLSENKRLQPNVIVFVDSKGLAEFHNELGNKKSKTKIPELKVTNWQTKQMEIQDPFGNLLRFNETFSE